MSDTQKLPVPGARCKRRQGGLCSAHHWLAVTLTGCRVAQKHPLEDIGQCREKGSGQSCNARISEDGSDSCWSGVSLLQSTSKIVARACEVTSAICCSAARLSQTQRACFDVLGAEYLSKVVYHVQLEGHTQLSSLILRFDVAVLTVFVCLRDQDAVNGYEGRFQDESLTERTNNR